jgi:uncharacterized protein
MASKLHNFWDSLTNVISGLGTTADPRTAALYLFQPLDQAQIEAAYRSSGLMRKVIDIPAFDMVREWRDWQAESDQIEKLEAEERRLGLRQKILLAEIMRGLGGGAIILGAPGDLALPLNERNPGKLVYAHVVSRYALTAQEWIDDLADPLCGGPKFWQVTTDARQQRIHPSRVVCFTGDPIPNLSGADHEQQFWGESRVQRVLDAVQDSDTARAAFATLIHKARNTIIGIPGLSDLVSTTDGQARVRGRISALMLGESMFNATLRDAGDGTPGAGETIDHRQVTWAGIPDIIRVFAEAVSAAADIPMTRLWGKAAEGMNSSGDSQQRDWTKMVRARQELMLRPCLDRIDALLIPTALGGKAPADVWWQFAPLDTPSEAEEATRFKSTMEAIEKLQNTGAIPDEAFAKATQNTIIEGGWMPGLEGALAEIPEAERYGLSADPDATDPSTLQAANENEVAAMEERGAINADQARALLTDAAPRTLYVSRKLLNASEFIEWAKGQGFETATPADELHVTICFSRTPVDWMKMGEAWGGDEQGKLTVKPGGARVVERLGDKGAVVLLFASSELSWRHEDMKRNGASFDLEAYQPHVTITFQAPADFDLSKVEPFRGELVFGPEIFTEVVEDWEQTVTEE